MASVAAVKNIAVGISAIQRDQRLVEAIARANSLAAAATSAATLLADELECTRVAIGLRSGRHSRIRGISATGRFDRRSDLLRATEAAMDEAIDQQRVLQHPAAAGAGPVPGSITAAQHTLSRAAGGLAVLSIPLPVIGRLCGALSIVGAEGLRVEPAAIARCVAVAELIGPLLEIHRLQDLSLRQVGAARLAQHWSRLRHIDHRRASIAGLVAVVAVAWLLLGTSMYRVTAPAVLEGELQRVVIAPRDGFISTATAAAGDVVADGAVLASLDDRDIELEQARWRSERDQLIRQHREVLAERNRARTTILEAQIAETEAELDRLAAERTRGRLIAPFAGVIISGDLKHQLGAPVKRGDILFELAPLDRWRVILQVDERDIAQLVPGQNSKLVLTALPGQTLTVTIARITPVAAVHDGRNSFRVEATLVDAGPALRPGMRGIAKIEIEPRRRVWIWTHDMVDYLRTRWWTW